MAKMITNDNDEGSGNDYMLDPGIYSFRVMDKMETPTGKVFSTIDTSSSKDDPQIQLILKVGDSDKQINLFESLTFSSKAQFRIRQFLLAVGAYPGHGVNIDLTAKMCIGLTGKCRTENKIPFNGQYEKTSIAEWIEAGVQDSHKIPGLIVTADTPEKNPEPDYSDDIPFN